MANPSHKLIETQTLTSSQTSVTFGAGGTIPQTYSDLRIIISGRVGSGSSWLGGIDLSFNSSRTTDLRRLFSYNGSVTGDTNVGGGQGEGGLINGVSSSSGVFGNAEIYISDYKSNIVKTYTADFVTESNSTSDAIMGYFNGANSSATSAITSITLAVAGYSFVSGSTFYLYGIKNT